MTAPADPTTRGVILDSLGVGIATGVYGISFGALATASGLSVWQACAISMLVFTGASQFAFIGVLAAGGTPWAAMPTAVLLGVRNMFYSVSLAKLFAGRGWRRWVAAQLVIDESAALASAHENDNLRRTAFWWTGLSVFVCWNFSTLVGALAGSEISDPRTIGLDAAVGAAFLGLLWHRLTNTFTRLIALVAGVVALIVVPLMPAGAPIMIGGAAAVLGGLVWQSRVDRLRST